jgi:hypothetical protein
MSEQTTLDLAPLSQTARILNLLKNQGKATNRELNVICFRYGARILDLRNEGHIIVSNHIKDGLWEFIYKGHTDDQKEDK